MISVIIHDNQSIWVWLNTTNFFSNCYFGCGSNQMFCDLVGPFLQSAFRPCYLGGGSKKYMPWEFFRGWGQPSSTFFHHYGCIISCLIILFHYLTSGRFSRVPPVFTDHIFQHLMSHQGSMFFFVTWCVNIGTKGWLVQGKLWSWVSTVVLIWRLASFFSWK